MSKVYKPMFSKNDLAPHPRSVTDGVVEAIKTLILSLPLAEQEKIQQFINDLISPITAPRAGEVLGKLLRLLPQQSAWTVEDLKSRVHDEGVEASPKEVYNALGYLARKGHIKRVGYGRYLVNGAEVATSDDFGGADSRHEDGYRI